MKIVCLHVFKVVFYFHFYFYFFIFTVYKAILRSSIQISFLYGSNFKAEEETTTYSRMKEIYINFSIPRTLYHFTLKFFIHSSFIFVFLSLSHSFIHFLSEIAHTRTTIGLYTVVLQDRSEIQRERELREEKGKINVEKYKKEGEEKSFFPRQAFSFSLIHSFIHSSSAVCTAKCQSNSISSSSYISNECAALYENFLYICMYTLHTERRKEELTVVERH